MRQIEQAYSGNLLNGERQTVKWKSEEWERLAVEIEPRFQGALHPGAEIRYIPEAPMSSWIIVTRV